jgi:hypothetical protein
VVNLFAWRATDPCALVGVDDPVGPDNDTHIRDAVVLCHPVVLAWGVHGDLRSRDWYVRQLVERSGQVPKCLGVTKGGHPRHPLYVPAAAPLVNFPGVKV